MGHTSNIIESCSESTESENNTIIGHSFNEINDRSCGGTIIGMCENCIDGKPNNNIIAAHMCNCISSNIGNSAILSGSSNFIINSYSNITSSRFSKIFQRSGTIIGGACNSIVGSSASFWSGIIGGYKNSICDNSCNSIIVSSNPVGMGFTASNCNNTVFTNEIFISGSVSTSPTGTRVNGINFCQIIGSVTSITVCNGIITSIS
jgi:hypothetical protein